MATWTQLWSHRQAAAYPDKRTAHAMIIYQDALYVYGGLGENLAGDDYEHEDSWKVSRSSLISPPSVP